MEKEDIKLNKEYVDLGLTSGNLWATCNLGANSPEEAGLYFQWGDTVGYTVEQIRELKKFSSDYSDYKFGNSKAFSKYNTTDKKEVLDLEDDAAYVMLGEGWRIPTKEDIIELCKETDIVIVDKNGVELDVNVTIKPENYKFPLELKFNSIDTAKEFKFYKKGDHSVCISIPFVGYCFSGHIFSLHQECYFLSSYLKHLNPLFATNFSCMGEDGEGYVDTDCRFYGIQIRPVYSHPKSYSINDMEMGTVDLGLPSGLLWGENNLGASSIEDAGLYFQWGDINGYSKEDIEAEGKRVFSTNWDDYKFGREGFTKYQSEDKLTVLEIEDDAAHYHLGDGWRIPKKEDIIELCENTDMFIALNNGEEIPIRITEEKGSLLHFSSKQVYIAKGLKFYKKGDNSVYLYIPFGGYVFDSKVYCLKNNCRFWSSSLFENNPIYAFVLICDAISGYGELRERYRRYGYPIRPVYSEKQNNKRNKEMEKRELNKESVDLGLPSGNLWGKCNLGANSEDEAGLYFQWGDTQGYTAEQVGTDKNFTINFSDYKFSIDGSLTNFTKYNESDGKTVLDLEDDAAHIILGEGWCMPTMDDFVELCQNTDMFIVSESGEEVPVTIAENSMYPLYFEFDRMDTAKAFKFYKKGVHSIYISIPLVGCANEGSVRGVSEVFYLWSSSLYSSISTYAFYCGYVATLGNGYVYSVTRYYGFPIRGIKKNTISNKPIILEEKRDNDNNEEKKDTLTFFKKMIECNKDFYQALEYAMSNKDMLSNLGEYNVSELKEIYEEAVSEYKNSLFYQDRLIDSCFLSKEIYEDGVIVLYAFKIKGMLYKDYLQRDIIKITFYGDRQVFEVTENDSDMSKTELLDEEYFKTLIPMELEKFESLYGILENPLSNVKGKLCQMLLE